MLGMLLLISQSTNLASSSPIPGDIPGSVEGSPRFDHLTYLPLVINDVNPVPNGDFELGRVAWAEYSGTSGAVLILNSGFPTEVSPHGGSWAAWLGQHIFFPLDESITQTVYIPPNRTMLHFWYWIKSVEPNPTYDYFKVFIQEADPFINWPLYTGTNTWGWVERTIDLSAYAGDNVIMIFNTHNDWDFASWIFLDDISLQKD